LTTDKPTMETDQRIAAESDKKLRKALTFQDLFFMSMGGIIGSGWLYAVDKGAYLAGPGAILSWIIGGIIVLFIALNYAEISGAIPRSGAIVRYPHLSHGGYTGFILGWAYLLSAVTVPTIEAEAVIGYAAVYIPSLLTPTGVLSAVGTLLAIILMVAFFFLNYVGVKFLGRFNTVITWWKFVLPVLTFLFLLGVFHVSNFTLTDPKTGMSGFAPLGWAPVFLAIPTGGIVFAYLGFRQALEFGGEAKNPQRDVPRATIYSVLAAMGIYTVLQIAFIGAIRWAAGGYTVGDWASLSAGPLHTAPLYNALGETGIAAFAAFAVLLLVDAWISPSGTGWIYTGTATRTFYGLSADGYLPKGLLRISEKTKIPVFSLIAAVVVGIIFLAPFPSWYLLVGFISGTTVFTYILGPLAVHIFRRTASNIKRPFRLPAAWLIAPLGFVGASLIVYWSGYVGLFYIWTAIFLGLPIFYLLYAPRRMGISFGLSTALGIVQFILIAVISYLGWVWTNMNYLVNAVGSALPDSVMIRGFTEYFILLVLVLYVPALLTQIVAKKESKQVMKASYWLLTVAVFTYAVSFFSVFGPLLKPLIAFPWDNVIIIIGMMLLYGWGVISGYRTEDIQELQELEGIGTAEESPSEVGTQ
jgi:amino acid transporter